MCERLSIENLALRQGSIFSKKIIRQIKGQIMQMFIMDSIFSPAVTGACVEWKVAGSENTWLGTANVHWRGRRHFRYQLKSLLAITTLIPGRAALRPELRKTENFLETLVLALTWAETQHQKLPMEIKTPGE